MITSTNDIIQRLSSLHDFLTSIFLKLCNIVNRVQKNGWIGCHIQRLMANKDFDDQVQLQNCVVLVFPAVLLS